MIYTKYSITKVMLWGCMLICQVGLFAQAKLTSDTAKVKNTKTIDVLFGTQNYDRFVGNSSSVAGNELKTYPAMQIKEALAGKLPGLFILQNNGNPGEENFSTFIRSNTFGYITLVDGVERTLSAYDIEQIENIQVLKDPVSKALYGGRISNGIIMVTTKRGKAMKSEFHASAQRGIKMPTALPKYLNSYDFATNYNKAIANDNNGVIPPGLGYNQTALDAYKNGNRPYEYPNVDFYDQFLNKSMDLTRFNTDYYGGNEKTKFYFHTGYQKEGGLEVYAENPTQMQTFNVQGNLDAKFSEAISVSASILSYVGNRQYPGSNTHALNTDGSRKNETWEFYELANRYPNAYPIFVAPDSAGGTSTFKNNPFATQAQSGYVRENLFRMQSDLSFLIKFDKLVKGLSWKPAFTFDFYTKQNVQKIHTLGIYNFTNFDGEGNPIAVAELQKQKFTTAQSLGDDDYSRRYNFTNTISYNQTFGDHAINADLVYYLAQNATTGEFFDYKRQNLGLRTNYNFLGKYTFEGVLNYVGSQSYAVNDRFRLFPALGVGWLMSNEKFIKQLKHVNFLKVNASWGVMGDGDIYPNLWRESWTSLANPYYFNTSSFANTGSISRVESNLLDWPTLSEIDLSIEAKLFNSLSTKLSYFNYQSSNQLSQRSNSIPSIIGGNLYLPQSNYGKTAMRGFELEMAYTGKAGKVNYHIGAHVTSSKSERLVVDELPDPLYSTVGDAIDDIRGYQAIGTYSQEDITNVINGTMAQPSYMSFTDLKAGNIKYRDVNNDKIIDKYDRVVIGNSSPRLMYGADLKVSYKGFEVYAMFVGYGAYNRNINNSYYAIFQNRKYSTVVVDGLPNGNAHPMLSTGSNQNDFQQSSWWIADGSFVKLQNAAVSYTLPKSWISPLKLKELKLSVYGTDLLKFSKIKDLDPESLDAGVTDYPLFSTLAVGLSITL